MGSLIRSVCLCLGLLLVVGCSGSSVSNINFDKQKVVFNGEEQPYAVYKPQNYDPKKSYPTIIFLHGLFEKGSNGTSQTKVGIGPAIAKNPERFNCIVVLPQTPSNWQEPESVELAGLVLDDAQKKYNIDPRKIVITGLSNGGAGAWLLGAKYPGRFAGLAPLCAFAEYDTTPKLTTVPIWAFHNSADFVVGASGTKEMVERINKAGGRAQVTIYSGFGHNCWDEAYSDPKVIAWLQSPK